MTVVKRENLIGWLCIYAFQSENEGGDKSLYVPHAVTDEWVRLGWVDREDGPDWRGLLGANPTESGQMLVDLHAPEWGFGTIEVEEEL